MAAPTKQTSRWGNFLQQAVAGVESRLDNILAEGAEEPGPQKKATTATAATGPVKNDGGALSLLRHMGISADALVI